MRSRKIGPIFVVGGLAHDQSCACPNRLILAFTGDQFRFFARFVLFCGCLSMANVKMGFISSIATFLRSASRREREDALKPFELTNDSGGVDLKAGIAAQFSSLCDLELKIVLRERSSRIKTVRVESGYGYAEHRKDWLRLGCELSVEEEEVPTAVSFFNDPMSAGAFDSRIEKAKGEFLEEYLVASIFDEVSASFFLYQDLKKD